MIASWIRPASFLAALVILIWMAFIFFSEPSVTVKDTIWDPATGESQDWQGEVSCTSLASFSDGRVANFDWVIQEDGTGAMEPKYEATVEHACAGVRASRSTLIGIAASATVLLVVAGVATQRRRNSVATKVE